jgi:hypothetical protein
MRLRFLKDKRQVVNWSDSPDKKHPEFTVFDPVGETSDERGKRLIANPAYQGWFEVVPEETPAGPAEPEKPTFACDVCGETLRSKAGLGAHKRKHKEQQ